MVPLGKAAVMAASKVEKRSSVASTSPVVGKPAAGENGLEPEARPADGGEDAPPEPVGGEDAASPSPCAPLCAQPPPCTPPAHCATPCASPAPLCVLPPPPYATPPPPTCCAPPPPCATIPTPGATSSQVAKLIIGVNSSPPTFHILFQVQHAFNSELSRETSTNYSDYNYLVRARTFYILLKSSLAISQFKLQFAQGILHYLLLVEQSFMFLVRTFISSSELESGYIRY